MYFSVIAFLLSGLAIASFLTYNSYKYTEQMGIVQVRAESMDDFLTSLGDDLERALYISSFRSLIALDDYVTNINKSQGRLLDNVTASFNQIIRNGTVQSNPQEELLMEDQTIHDWITKIERIAWDIGINASINMTSLSIGHTSPWTVGVTGNFTVQLKDTKGVAEWRKTIITQTEIPITEFRDPLYANRTHGEYRQVNATDITSWNVSNLRLLLESGKYVAKSSSPTFLMRMEGRMDGDPNGILTLIDADHLNAPENRSMVDFVYFGMEENDTQYIHGITDQGYPHFTLDPEHIVFFSVEGQNYTQP